MAWHEGRASAEGEAAGVEGPQPAARGATKNTTAKRVDFMVQGPSPAPAGESRARGVAAAGPYVSCFAPGHAMSAASSSPPSDRAVATPLPTTTPIPTTTPTPTTTAIALPTPAPSKSVRRPRTLTIVPPSPNSPLGRTIDVFVATWHGMGRSRALLHAGSLAFWTMLTVVPFFIVAAALVITFGGDRAERGLLGQLHQMLIPVAGTQVTTFFDEAVKRSTTAANLGLAGGLALIVASVLLFFDVEVAFNDVWSVERRPLRERVLLYYALVTLGPLVFTASLLQTTDAVMAIARSGPLEAMSRALGPMLTSVPVLALAYRYLPNAKVRWHPACLAAFVTALLVEAAKIAFNLYVGRVLATRYDLIYGPIGLIPIFLTWVFVTWVLVLGGAQFCFCLEHLETAKRAHAAHAPVAGPRTALAVFAAVARSFARGEGPLDADAVAEWAGCDKAVAVALLERLTRAKLFLCTTAEGRAVYHPARPLDEIPLSVVVAACDDEGLRPDAAVEAVLSRAPDSLVGSKASDLTRD
jgi:membrane protein